MWVEKGTFLLVSDCRDKRFWLIRGPDPIEILLYLELLMFVFIGYIVIRNKMLLIREKTNDRNRTNKQTYTQTKIHTNKRQTSKHTHKYTHKQTYIHI